MTSIAVELEAGRWIKDQIESNSDLTAWLDVIPATVNLPAVRFQVQSRNDAVTVERHIALTSMTFLVVASVQGGDLAELVGYVEDIHGALHRQSGATAKATILSCARTAPFGMTDVQGADVFRHAGGMYEVFAREIP